MERNRQTNPMRRIIVIVVIVAFAAGVAVGVLWSDRVNAPTISATGGTSSSDTPSDGGTAGTNDSVQQGIPSTATEASVEFVYDGDTIFLVDGRKVRLLGIDTPEIGDNRECYGDEATTLLRQLLPEGTDVWVQPDIDPLDRYGRSLLFVYTDGVVDARDAKGKSFTEERMLEEISRYADSPDTVLKQIMSSLHNHIADQDQYDDITFAFLINS